MIRSMETHNLHCKAEIYPYLLTFDTVLQSAYRSYKCDRQQKVYKHQTKFLIAYPPYVGSFASAVFYSHFEDHWKGHLGLTILEIIIKL